MSCVFCSIIENNDPHHEIVWSDEQHLAFLNIYPAQPGHLLVIPRAHTDYAFDLPPGDFNALMEASRRLALPLKAELKPERVALAIDGFHVPHVHVHLVPSNKSGDLLKKRDERAPAEELARMGERLRAAFAAFI